AVSGAAEQGSKFDRGDAAPRFQPRARRRYRTGGEIQKADVTVPQTLISFEIRNENDVVLARQKSRVIAATLKFDAQDQTRIATAVSEIARNTLQYGGGGSVEFFLESTPQPRLLVTLRDDGRGIANLQEILDGKHVSQTGMGRGVIGAKKLMDHFFIE